MPPKPQPGTEAYTLRAYIREAREVIADLKAVTREARQAISLLVDGFEQVHKREMEQLSNHLQQEANRAASRLEQEVQAAQQYILYRLTAADLQLDLDKGVAVLHFPPGYFDDHIPLPYPSASTERTPE